MYIRLFKGEKAISTPVINYESEMLQLIYLHEFVFDFLRFDKFLFQWFYKEICSVLGFYVNKSGLFQNLKFNTKRWI